LWFYPTYIPLRRKQHKKTQFHTFENCMVGGPELRMTWHSLFGEPWGADSALIVELGCGRGDFALGLAEHYPQARILGVDVKSDRLWAAGKAALARNLPNVRFMQGYIQALTEYFGNAEVDTLWITFPDPFPKKRHAARRMLAPSFLADYASILKPQGLIHLKTDNAGLFDFALRVLEAHAIQPEVVITDVHAAAPHYPLPELAFLTAYERRFMAEGLPIQYLRFRLPAGFQALPLDAIPLPDEPEDAIR
jgi:tRNA (guanine-N7-)-methyltransferase